MVTIRGTIKGNIHERIFQVGNVRVVSQLGVSTHIKDVEAAINILVEIATELDSINGITCLVDPLELNSMYIVVDGYKIPINYIYPGIEIDYKRL